MTIYAIQDLPQHRIIEFFKKQWGSPEMVISSGVYDCSVLDGFTFINDENKIIGLITFIIKGNECEIISLDSIEEGKGIGSSLVQEVENIARKNKCKLLKIIKTNDNLLALKFYQKRGFRLSQIMVDAVQKARKLKPEIPLKGNDSIPIQDEIELIKILN